MPAAGRAPAGEIAARRCLSGTMLLILQFGYFYLRRLPAAKRKAFIPYFCDLLREELEAMHMEARGLLAG